MFHHLELWPGTFREAERLLMSFEIPLRAADAPHVVLALGSRARAVLTFDEKLARAAQRSWFGESPLRKHCPNGGTSVILDGRARSVSPVSVGWGLGQGAFGGAALAALNGLRLQ